MLHEILPRCDLLDELGLCYLVSDGPLVELLEDQLLLVMCHVDPTRCKELANLK